MAIYVIVALVAVAVTLLVSIPVTANLSVKKKRNSGFMDFLCEKGSLLRKFCRFFVRLKGKKILYRLYRLHKVSFRFYVDFLKNSV